MALNSKSKPFNLATARAMLAEHEQGKTVRQIAEAYEITGQRASESIVIASLPEPVLTMYSEGRIGVHTLLGLATNSTLSDEDLRRLADKIVAGQIPTGHDDHGRSPARAVAVASSIINPQLREEFLSTAMTVDEAERRHHEYLEALGSHLRAKNRAQRDAAVPVPEQFWLDPASRSKLEHLEHALIIIAGLMVNDPPPTSVADWWLTKVRSIHEVAGDVVAQWTPPDDRRALAAWAGQIIEEAQR